MTTRKAQRPRKERSLTWNREAGIIWIRQGEEEVGYFVDEIRSDFGRAFEFTKLLDRTCTYHVHIDTAGVRTCDCKGCTRWHHCKHSDAAAFLIETGRI